MNSFEQTIHTLTNNLLNDIIKVVHANFSSPEGSKTKKALTKKSRKGYQASYSYSTNTWYYVGANGRMFKASRPRDLARRAAQRGHSVTF